MRASTNAPASVLGSALPQELLPGSLCNNRHGVTLIFHLERAWGGGGER